MPTGDMAALAELRERVTPGMRLRIINHDYANDSGTATVDEVTAEVVHVKLDKARHSQARKYTRSYISWPKEGDDFEVSGTTLRIFKPYHAYTGGRAIIRTYRFGEG